MVVKKPPKSHNGLRTLALDPETAEMLRKAGQDSHSPYVFVGRTGTLTYRGLRLPRL